MQKAFLIGSIMSLGLVLGGCTSSSTSAPSNSTNQDAAKPAIEQKQGDTTITGTITKAGTSFFITESGKAPKGIDSYAIDLAQYEGQTVTVTGQYSGDTLFVGKIE